MNTFKSVAIAVSALTIAGLMAAPVQASAYGNHRKSSHKKTSHKVTICHRTNSVTNRYVKTTVSYSAYDGNKKNDHTHHTGPWAYSEEYARELKKNHIKWGDIVDSDKCETQQREVKKHDKKQDCKPQPETPQKPEQPKKDEPKPQILATSTDTPSKPASKGKVLALANTGETSTAVSALVAIAIMGAVGATAYIARRKPA